MHQWVLNVAAYWLVIHFTRYQSSEIDNILHQNFNLVRVLLYIYMRVQIFRVKKPSCKILKTKNCVPFEVQSYSSK